MYAASRQNQDQKTFIAGGLDPLIAMLYRKVAGEAGVIIYIFVKWQLGFPHYMTKQKEPDPIKQYQDAKRWIWYGSKNKNESIKKVRKRKFNTNVLARKFRQGATSEVIN